MNRATSLLGAIFVVAIALVFVVQFRPASNARTASGPDCAARVNGTCIPATHYWAEYRLLGRYMDATALRRMNLRRLTAEALIERHLLNLDAKRLGITVSDDDISAEIFAGRAHVSLPVEHARELAYQLGGDQLGARLLEEGVRLLSVRDRKTKKFDLTQSEKEVRLVTQLSPTDFRDFQREEMIAQRMRDLVRARVRVSEAEAYDVYQRDKATATIDYVKFDRRFYADIALDTSPKAVDAWAAQHKEDLDKLWEQQKSQYLPECRVVRQILAKLDPGATDPEAAKAAAKKKIDEAAARLTKGEAFADVARSLSEDETTANKGGDLGCAPKGKLVKPVEDAIFSMEAGKTSDPIETEEGFVVVRVEQIAKDADAEKLAKHQIAVAQYTGAESETMAAEAAKQVLAAVRGGKSLQDALKEHLAQIAAKAKATPKPAGAAKPDKDAKKGAKDSKSDTSGPKSAPYTVETHPNRPTVETSLPFNASGDPIQGVRGQDAAEIAFGLDKPGAVPNDVLPLDTGYAVMQLKDKKAANKDDWAKERDTYLTGMRNKKQIEALSAYIRQLRAKLGSEVKYETSIVSEPKEEPKQAPAEEPTEEE